ncbi:hypothetical protein COCNU_04G003420 [Cocos nucifera]|uniref:Uncharacterized protein n=1 Tax=Cocos nucifera TaxID=13894 RepID=A0A8K0I566_COCNU|nr:hypothetical protein COCNU_04G003420 [Cocos nucifera]
MIVIRDHDRWPGIGDSVGEAGETVDAVRVGDDENLERHQGGQSGLKIMRTEKDIETTGEVAVGRARGSVVDDCSTRKVRKQTPKVTTQVATTGMGIPTMPNMCWAWMVCDVDGRMPFIFSWVDAPCGRGYGA